MKYDNLSKVELISIIEKLELDLIKTNSSNKKLEKAEDEATQQSSILKFINSIAIPSADKSSVEEFSKILLRAVKKYTGANLATFNLYQPDKKELALLHIEAEKGILKTVLKIAGDKIVKTASPVDDETYELIIKNMVDRYYTFTEVSFGAIPKLVDKAIRESTGIDRLYPIAHVIDGELYGTTMLAFKKGQASPSIEMLESYAHLMSVSMKRYNTEKALKESENRFRSMFENHSAAMLLIEPDSGKILDSNKSAVNFYGYSIEELSSMKIDDINTSESEEIKQKRKEAETLEANHFEFQHQLKNNTIRDVEVHSTPIEYMNQKLLFSIIYDITDRKQAENALIESEERVKFALEIDNAGTWELNLMDHSSRRTLLHDQIFGYKTLLPKWTFEMFLEHVIPEDRNNVETLFVEAVKTISDWDFECRIQRPDGELRWISATGRHIINSGGKATHLLGIVKDITERKTAELELINAKDKAEESEEKYRLLHENAGLGIGYISPKGIVLSFNTIAARDMNGVPEDFAGKSIFDIFPKTAADAYFKRLIKAVNSNKVEVYEDFVQLPSQKKWFLSTYTKIVDSKNNILGIQIISQDITEIKQSETELKKAKDKAEESKANVTAIIEGTESSIWAFDRNYQILYINHVFQQEFLQSFGVLLEPGKSLIKALPKSLQPLWKPRYDRVLANEQFTIVDSVPTNIGLLYIQISFNPIIKNGQVIGGSCFGSNITSRILAEIELTTAKEKAEESERKLIEAQELAHIGNFEYLIDNGTVSWSKELFNIFERSTDLPAPKYDLQRPFYTEESFAKLDKAVQDCIQHQIPYDIELDIITSSGSIKTIISKGDAIKDENNKVIGLYGTAQDVTKMKKIEQDLIKAKDKAEESDRLKSAFLANMSHEIRTPMNGILGFASLLKEPKLSGEQQKKYIGIIEKSGARMLSIINDIIDISKIEAGLMKLNITESDINDQIEYIYTFFKPEVEAKGMKLFLKNTLDEKEVIIKTDREKVFAVLTNLVKNAIKYSIQGFIEIGCSKKGDSLEFFVKDTGIGIPKERQEAIFERFIQADIDDVQARQGAGLGLSISKAYVEMLGGKIWAVSEEEKGSSFYFTIPNHEASKKETGHDTIDVDNDFLKLDLKVLIVEDDETSYELLSIIGAKYAREIISVTNGNEALESCRNNPDIDLILLDIRLPGMNGYEVTRQIRTFNKEVIIIAQTAYGLSGDREKAIKAGCNDYISKPVNKEIFDALIQTYF